VLIGVAVMMAVRPGRGAFMAMPLLAQLGLTLLRELVALGLVSIDGRAHRRDMRSSTAAWQKAHSQGD
jgi:hypothetical protein